MPSETWTSSDQDQLTALLAEATEAVSVCIRCADQLLDGSAPDEALRASEALAAYERGMALATVLYPLSARKRRVFEGATDASS